MFKPTGNLRRDFDHLMDMYLRLHDNFEAYKEQCKPTERLIESLKKELRHANEHRENDKVMHARELQKVYENCKKEIAQMKEAHKKEKEYLEEEIAERDAVIRKLTNEVAHLQALLNRDGTNTGIPTSQTPINKEKRIPNSRQKTGRKKGGQPGHKKVTLEAFNDSEVNEIALHELDTEKESCDACGGELIFTGECIEKDEFDVIIKTIKRRHRYALYECQDCGTISHLPISKHLKEQNQYGNNIQALALSLMVTGNMAINKVGTIISGMTEGEMHPSDGYICKLYQRAARNLDTFMFDLKKQLIQRKLLYWDDTVIMVNTSRACMRIYCDEQISYYAAHEKKNLQGIMDDNVLNLLTEETTVMHDHNVLNYNDMFSFKNIECIQHLERDLQKSADDNPDHTWAKEMKKTISEYISKRKNYMASGNEGFEKDEEEAFYARIKELIQLGYTESAKSTNRTTNPPEKTLLARLEKHYDNYFSWVFNFLLPTTNNISERALRCIKSHMKISGQFESIEAAQNYAIVKTYVETCRKNGINEIVALTRLCSGKPCTINEIFKLTS